MDNERLSGDRVDETNEFIRARVQAAHNLKTKGFSNYGSDIVFNADMLIGEIRQSCKLPVLKLARTIADLAGCEDIQSVDLEALHAPQPAEADLELAIFHQTTVAYIPGLVFGKLHST